MIYSKLQFCKILFSEIEALKKEREKLNCGDSLTAVGLRHRKQAQHYDGVIKNLRVELQKQEDEITKSDAFKKMDAVAQKFCKDYYFEGKTGNQCSPEENIVRRIRTCCRRS